MDIWHMLVVAGIPTAITGFLVWWIQRRLTKKEEAREKREENVEKLMLLIMRETRATNVLATATAKAVQRIPDAHCNGDMTAALEQAAKIQAEEKDMLFDHGVKHIFGE